MIIPGIAVAILTFPGVILHEYAHKIFCEQYNVKVLEVCYFQFSNPVGYVKHEIPSEYKQIFFISVGPFILNSIVALGIFVLAGTVSHLSLVMWFLSWLGISIAMHAIPSSGDAKVLWRQSKLFYKTDKVALLGFPISATIYLISKLRVIWSDLIYAMILFRLAFLGTF